MKLGIFSGNCLIGKCGDETDLIDYKGELPEAFKGLV